MTSTTHLARIRTSKGLTQDQLCARSGVSQQAISQIERGQGNPTLETLRRLARALDVPVGDLLNEPVAA